MDVESPGGVHAGGSPVIAAGYLGVRPRPRPEGMDARFVRDPLITLAADLVPIGPRCTWVGSADGALADLGVAASSFRDARAWIDELERDGGILYPDLCRSPDDVVAFARLFVPGGLAVLGVGMDLEHVDGFLTEQGPSDPEPGLLVRLREGRRLALGHRPLGYEPVAVQYGSLSCSWACNGLQAEVALATGVVPNEWGFIDTPEEAEAVMAFLADPAVGKEPGTWRAWLVVRYDAVAGPPREAVAVADPGGT